MVIRTIALAAALMGALVAVPAQAEMGTYSEGYRMGMLSKWSYKGLFSKTGEGELLMGNDSSPWIKVTGSGDSKTRVQMNPWAFSSDEAIYNQNRSKVGNYVVIRYREVLVQFTSTGGDTKYRVEEVQELAKAAPTTPCGSQEASGGKSDGDRVGRVVKVSLKGTIEKSYEMTLQVGNAGGQFIEMSISDPAIYECAVNFLKSGKRVKLTYDQSILRNPLARDTAYNVVGLAPIATLTD